MDSVAPKHEPQRAARAASTWKPRPITTPISKPCDTIELQIVLVWEAPLRVRPIGMQDSFFELGGDAQLAEQLIVKIRKLSGRSLSLSEFLMKPTVAQLVEMIKRTRWAPYWTSLVSIREGGSPPPLFFVHGPRGYVFLYYHVARHLSSDQPVYGLQAVGVNRGHTPHFSFQEMAAHYVDEMRSLQPEGPYFLSGFCLGGVLAYEMSRQLHAQGQRVGLLALIDAYPYVQPRANKSQRSSENRSALGARAIRHLERFWSRDAKHKFAYALQRLRFALRVAKIRAWDRLYNHYRKRGRPLPWLLQNVFMINVRALRDYKLEPYSGNVTLLMTDGAEEEMGVAPDEIWRPYAHGGLVLHSIACDHENLMTDPNARQVATILQQGLDQAVAGPCTHTSDCSV